MPFKHHKRDNRLAGGWVGTAHNSRFGDQFVGYQCRFNFSATQAMPGDAKYVVRTPQYPAVTVFIDLGVIARHITPAELFREIAFLITLRITPHGTDHRRP